MHGGLKQTGFMFDVRVPTVEEGGPPEGLSIIAVEMSTFLEDEICVEVYSKRGTHQGFENDVYEDADGSWSSDTWSILGAAMVEGQGEGLPTSLPIGSLDKVYLQPGSTQALYVTLTVPEMRYTEPKYNEQSGDLFSTSDDGHLELMVGSAVAYPFEEVWANRIFNGAVIYALGDVEDGKYSDVMEGDRLRACPAPPTGPVAYPPVDVNATTASPCEEYRNEEQCGLDIECLWVVERCITLPTPSSSTAAATATAAPPKEVVGTPNYGEYLH